MKLKKGDHKPKELDSKEVMQEKNRTLSLSYMKIVLLIVP